MTIIQMFCHALYSYTQGTQEKLRFIQKLFIYEIPIELKK
jgi:hypothetical protein